MPVLRRWTGSEWQAVGSEGTVDTSGLVTLDTPQTITGDKTFQDLSVVRGAETLSSVLTDNEVPIKISAGPRAEAPMNPALNDIWIITDEGTDEAMVMGSGGSREIDYAERAAVFDVITTAGRTYTDVEGLFLTVPAQTEPYYIEFGGIIHFVTGTAANGTWVTVFAAAVDEVTGASWGYTATTEKQVGTASINSQRPIQFARRIPPHTEERTYRLRMRLDALAPTGWTTAQLLASDAPTQGFWPPAYFRAVKA